MKLCIFHDWVKEELIEEKKNNSGFIVYVYICRCSKCGKVKIKEFLI